MVVAICVFALGENINLVGQHFFNWNTIDIEHWVSLTHSVLKMSTYV